MAAAVHLKPLNELVIQHASGAFIQAIMRDALSFAAESRDKPSMCMVVAPALCSNWICTYHYHCIPTSRSDHTDLLSAPVPLAPELLLLLLALRLLLLLLEGWVLLQGEVPPKAGLMAPALAWGSCRQGDSNTAVAYGTHQQGTTCDSSQLHVVWQPFGHSPSCVQRHSIMLCVAGCVIFNMNLIALAAGAWCLM